MIPANGRKKLYHKRVSPIVRKGGRSNDIHIPKINEKNTSKPATGEYLFGNFFDAFYWAACTLTTVGYGDLYPISETGRVISIVSSFVGIAIIALPSGVITAGYLKELEKRENALNNDHDKELCK